MGKDLRISIAILATLGLLFLAGNQAAWAAKPGSESSQPAQGQVKLSVSTGKDKDCKDDRHKDKRNHKKKDKCKDDDDRDDDDHGSVRPPRDDDDICKKGDYSVGGVASLQVKKLRGRGWDHGDDDRDPDCFKTSVLPADSVSGLPSRAGAVLSDVVVLESLGPGSSVKICFAAPPGKKVKIYTSRGDSWKGIGTSVKKGQACASVPRSGSFTLVGR